MSSWRLLANRESDLRAKSRIEGHWYCFAGLSATLSFPADRNQFSEVSTSVWYFCNRERVVTIPKIETAIKSTAHIYTRTEDYKYFIQYANRGGICIPFAPSKDTSLLSLSWDYSIKNSPFIQKNFRSRGFIVTLLCRINDWAGRRKRMRKTSQVRTFKIDRLQRQLRIEVTEKPVQIQFIDRTDQIVRRRHFAHTLKSIHYTLYGSAVAAYEPTTKKKRLSRSGDTLRSPVRCFVRRYWSWSCCLKRFTANLRKKSQYVFIPIVGRKQWCCELI